jgi:hypothetical protein
MATGNEGRSLAGAELDESARQATHSPMNGRDPGVTLDGAGPEQLASLGMSAGADVPSVGPLVAPPTWIGQTEEGA